MKVILLTQDDPFYLAKNISYLVENLPIDISIEGCVVFDVSPFGKRESFLQKLKKTWKIFGTTFFFKYALEFLRKKVNTHSNVKNVLRRYNIPVVELKKGINHPKSLAIIQSRRPDVLVSIAGNQIFKRPLLELAPKGCINLHTALLPKYRGLMPSFWVLKNNEKKTGVSVFFVDEGIDSGPIIVQKEVEIGNKTQKQLIEHTKKLGMDAVIEALELIKNDSVSLILNPDEEMSYYSFPTREDVKEFKRIGKKFF